MMRIRDATLADRRFIAIANTALAQETEGHVLDPKLLEAGVIRCGASRSLELRLREIHQGVVEVLTAFRPQVMALEQLYSHYDRPRTAILMGHARGVICLAAGFVDVPVVHYAATQVKRILTGAGHAPKQQMQLAICRELGLAQPPDPPDIADALAIALCHYYLGIKPGT